MIGVVAGVIGYAAAFACIESIGALGNHVVSVVGHCLLIAVLLAHMALRPRGRLGAIPAALAVVSLLRLLSYGMPFGGLTVGLRAAVVAVPLLLAVVLALRLPGLSGARLGLRPRSWRVQALVGLSGLPLGLLAAWAGLGAPAVGAWPQVTATAVGLGLAGAVEELVFRGVVQQAAAGVLGRGAFLLSGGVFTAAYAAAGSVTAVVVAALVGLLFGVSAQVSRSVVGVAVAHALLNVGAGLVWARLVG